MLYVCYFNVLLSNLDLGLVILGYEFVVLFVLVLYFYFGVLLIMVLFLRKMVNFY